MLTADETQLLAARARTAARAVVGLVLEEDRAARFLQRYVSDYQRQGVLGEAEQKAELLAAVERESLLLVAACIERNLPRVTRARIPRHAQAGAVTGFRQAFLTFLGGSLAWDGDERESFRRDLAMYVRLAEREADRIGTRPGHVPAAGAFVDRCAFLVDPSMMAQAREAAARYQAQLEFCAEDALHAAFRATSRPASLSAPSRVPRMPAAAATKPKPRKRVKPKPKPKPKPRPKRAPKPKPKAKPAIKPRPKPFRAGRSRPSHPPGRPKSPPHRSASPRKKPTRPPRHAPAGRKR